MNLLTGKFKSMLKAAGYLAKHFGETPKNIVDISDDTGMSISYLEQLFCILRKKKLVIGTRGPGGGYSLSRPADHIKLSEIIDADEDEESIFKLIKDVTLKEACS